MSLLTYPDARVLAAANSAPARSECAGRSARSSAHAPKRPTAGVAVLRLRGVISAQCRPEFALVHFGRPGTMWVRHEVAVMRAARVGVFVALGDRVAQRDGEASMTTWSLGRDLLAARALLLPLMLAGACAGTGEQDGEGASDRAPDLDDSATPLDREFAAAADEFAVPVDLLKAIGYVETRWEMVAGVEEHEGQAPAAGVMALRGDAMARGAALAGVDTGSAARNRPHNIRAAAALMAELAAELAIEVDDLAAWAPVVAALSGIDDLEGQAEQVQRVYAVLREGIAAGEGVSLKSAVPCWIISISCDDLGSGICPRPSKLICHVSATA